MLHPDQRPGRACCSCNAVLFPLQYQSPLRPTAIGPRFHSRDPTLMPTYVTEFIGTFLLVLTVGLTVTANLPLAPQTIYASLMVIVCMGAHDSGAHRVKAPRVDGRTV